MWKKIALNVFYNVAIFVSLTVAYWGFQNKQYVFMLAALFAACILIPLKIKLLKQVRGLNKNP